jgi:hypothetical protein
MNRTPRRITLQLVSLFDLLIIVVFAQYLDVGQRSRDAMARGEAEMRELRAEVDSLRETRRTEAESLAAKEAERKTLERDLATLTTARDRLRDRALELERMADDVRDDLRVAGDVLVGVMDRNRDEIETLIRANKAADQTAAKEELDRLAAGRSAAAARHLMTWGELRKRVDLWQIHMGDDGVANFRTTDRTLRFRAKTSTQFEAEMVRGFRELPQQKILVLMLLSWGDVDLATRNAATQGLERVAIRLREETDRRSRFDLAVLGFLPDGPDFLPKPDAGK